MLIRKSTVQLNPVFRGMVPDSRARSSLRSDRATDVRSADEAFGDADDRRRQRREDRVAVGHLRSSWRRMHEGALPQHPLHL